MAFCVPIRSFGLEAILHASYNPMERRMKRMRSMPSFISTQSTQPFTSYTEIKSAYP